MSHLCLYFYYYNFFNCYLDICLLFMDYIFITISTLANISQATVIVVTYAEILGFFLLQPVKISICKLINTNVNFTNKFLLERLLVTEEIVLIKRTCDMASTTTNNNPSSKVLSICLLIYCLSYCFISLCICNW